MPMMLMILTHLAARCGRSGFIASLTALVRLLLQPSLDGLLRYRTCRPTR